MDAKAERQKRMAALAEQQRQRRAGQVAAAQALQQQHHQQQQQQAQQTQQAQERQRRAHAEAKERKRREEAEAKRRQERQVAFPSADNGAQQQQQQQQPGAQRSNVAQHPGSQRGVRQLQRQQQQQQQQQKPQLPHPVPSHAIKAAGNRESAPSFASSTRSHSSSHDPVVAAAASAPTIFSNIIANEEAQELRTYARIIEQQNRRLAELERHQKFLEAEVEQRTAAAQGLEASLERREREWKVENDSLRAERDKWRNSVQAEQTKNERLLALVNRKDMEIQRMIQRKV